MNEVYIRVIKQHLAELSPDERISFINMLIEDYCRYCGNKPIGDVCYCWNDE